MTRDEMIAAVEAEAAGRFGRRLDRFSHSFSTRKQLGVRLLAEDLRHQDRMALPKALDRLAAATADLPLEGYRVQFHTDVVTADEYVCIDVMTVPLEAA